MHHKTRIIAEIGSNHLGDMKIAESMIQVAAEIGVDFVKFQSWQAKKLRKDFPDYEPTFKRHEKTEISDEDHCNLLDLCQKYGVEFLTTCFDMDRIDFLTSLDLKHIKVASPDSTSFTLIDKLIEVFPHVIISTGMTEQDELEKLIRHVKGAHVTLMHCVSLYPTPLDRINLDRMEWIQSQGIDAGFSDHSLGTEAAKLAIAMGASFLERHFTLSRSLPGKDQAMSTEPCELKELVEWSYAVPKMRGESKPPLTEAEKKLRGIYTGKWGDNR